jgi:uncharacterized protein (TIGR03083 family)
MDFGALLETLDGEARRSIDVVRQLPDETFALPTRCPPWDVRVLIGHMVRDLDRVLTYIADPAPEAAITDAVTYFQSYDPRAEGPRITAGSVEVAERYGTPAELVEGFDSTLRRCLEEAAREDPARALGTRLTSIRLDEFMKTRILEMGVHGMDLAAALGRRPWLTPAAASVVLSMLIGLLGEDPTSALGWSDLTFIETATGRRPLTDAERSVLGDRADAFPLLG